LTPRISPADRSPDDIHQPSGSRLGREARERLPWEDAPQPRGGWYAYRVTGPATLPSWAVEVALAVERPLEPGPEGSTSQDGETHRGRAAASQRPNPSGARWNAAVQAVVLLRAPGRVNWLADLAEVIAEVEAAAGIRGGPGADSFAGNVTGTRLRLLVGPSLSGLVPIPAATAELHLAAAGARGLPAPLRRRQPVVRGMQLSWRAGAGSVLTCDGPCGMSAQAVVGLGGTGNPDAVTPPPGGALVLRAWRARRTWGAACGLVLGAAVAAGLGREAGRVAARARSAGWDAVVLQGEAAMQLARAGDHRVAAPGAASRAASGTQVATLFEDCLAAGGLGRPLAGAGSLWALARTP
jgi:hypothetical protein